MIIVMIDDREHKILLREVLLGFWKIHILHHAAKAPVVGQWMLQELRRHGCDVSPGTLYPILKRMEANGWLRGESAPGGGLHARRSYYLTPKGAEILAFLRAMVAELKGEVLPAPAGTKAARKPVK